MNKQLYIISGCNGAGKTTASFTILPDILNCKEFINADEIAKGLSPFQPETVSLEAGRIMLTRIDELIRQGKTFAFETTLATKSYKSKIIKAKEAGYTITLLYFWLQNVELAKERVKTRVEEGGHHIDEKTIERRYFAGIKNLFDIYLNVVDELLIFDNTLDSPILIGEKVKDDNLINILDNQRFEQFKFLYHEKS